ncbi:MAG: amidohydrolase family protein [Candidatus Latescibacterota bacterium]
MVLDGHIHLMNDRGSAADLVSRMGEAGIDGGILISRPPACFAQLAEAAPPARRLEQVLDWCAGRDRLFPFYWVDPLEADALEQVEAAARAGVAGLKVICDRYRPGDARALEVFAAIAGANRPLMFHSGILWDAKPSSYHNRPVEFEALLEVPGLRFSMAHISWPWCDEMIAVYGKFQSARRHRPELSVELFVDTTPGTPPLYRREALTRLFTVGYDVHSNVFFGSDCTADAYDLVYARQWLERDRGILEDLGVGARVARNVFAGNLLRFLGREA